MDQTGVTLATYATEEIIAEIRRRQTATGAQKTREALRDTWEDIGALERRTGLLRWQCVAALGRLADAGQAEWTVMAGVIFWRMAKYVDFAYLRIYV